MSFFYYFPTQPWRNNVFLCSLITHPLDVGVYLELRFWANFDNFWYTEECTDSESNWEGEPAASLLFRDPLFCRGVAALFFFTISESSLGQPLWCTTAISLGFAVVSSNPRIKALHLSPYFQPSAIPISSGQSHGHGI